jgi:hypothetical protein
MAPSDQHHLHMTPKEVMNDPPKVHLRTTFAPCAQIVTHDTNLWVSTHVTTKSVAHRALWCKRV